MTEHTHNIIMAKDKDRDNGRTRLLRRWVRVMSCTALCGVVDAFHWTALVDGLKARAVGSAPGSVDMNMKRQQKGKVKAKGQSPVYGSSSPHSARSVFSAEISPSIIQPASSLPAAGAGPGPGLAYLIIGIPTVARPNGNPQYYLHTQHTHTHTHTHPRKHIHTIFLDVSRLCLMVAVRCNQ